MGKIPAVGTSNPPHLRSERCQFARPAAVAAAPRPLGPPLPCPFPSRPGIACQAGALPREWEWGAGYLGPDLASSYAR